MSRFVQLGDHDVAFDLIVILDRLAGRPALPTVPSTKPEEEKTKQAADSSNAAAAAPPSPAPSALQQLVLSSNWFSFVQTVLPEIDSALSIPNSTPTVQTQQHRPSEEEAEIILSAIEAVMQKLQPKQLPALLNQFTTILTKTSASSSSSSASAFPFLLPGSPALRLRHLIALFNLLQTNFTNDSFPSLDVFLLTLLISFIKFAITTQQQPSLYSHFTLIPQLVKQLEEATGASKNLLPLVAEVHELLYGLVVAAGASQSVVDEYLFRYLKAVDSLPSPSPAVLNAARLPARAAALRAITAAHPFHPSPSCFSSIPSPSSSSSFSSSSNPSSTSVIDLTPSRLLTFSSVRNLAASNDIEDSRVYQLLTIFANPETAVQQYVTFAAANQSWLNGHSQLQHVSNVNKLRTLAICGLAQQAQVESGSVIRFDTIRQKLQLSDMSEVETAVIDAIVSGRIEARIDQEKGVVCIKRVAGSVLKVEGGSSAPKVAADWNGLLSKLTSWKKNVHGVLTTLQQAQPMTHAIGVGASGELDEEL